MASHNTIPNKEDFSLVWLDQTLHMEHRDLRDLSKLREVVYYLRTYVEPKICLTDLEAMSQEKIFLIVSGTTGENFVPLIHDLPQIQSIYILCLHKRQQTQWTSAFSKIRPDDIFTHIIPLIDRLKIDLFNCEHVSDMNFKIEKAVVDIHYKTADFKWSRLLTRTLTKLSRDDKAQQEMIDYLRDYFKDSLANLEFLDDLSRTYEISQAVRWYTRAGCLFRVLNRAFREENIEEIYRYRSFIKDLSEQLDLLFDEQKETFGCSSYSVSRIDKDVALSFIQPSNRVEQKEAVLFEFYVDSALSTTSYAYVGLQSINVDELEMLFNINSIFRINNVQYDEACLRWFVQCSLCSKSEVEPLYNEDDSLEYDPCHSNLFHFGFLLNASGQPSRAERFYLKLLEESSNDSSAQFDCFAGLGAVFFDMGDYSRALEYYATALKMNDESETVYCNVANIYDNMAEYDLALEFYARSLSLNSAENDSNLGTILSNIGNVYHHQGIYNRALEIYEIASNIFHDIYGNRHQHPKQAGLYNNIALAHTRNGTYDKALEYYHDVLTILKKTLPSYHPKLGYCYNNIGIVLFCQGDSDSAFQYSQMALAIEEPLGFHHPDLATTYGNLAIIYSTRCQYDLAISYHERAISMIKERLSEQHPDLAARYVDLGITLTKQRQFDEATNVFVKARTIYENTSDIILPTEHPRLALCYSSIASLCCERDDFKQAFELYTRSLKIRQAALRANHPDIATNLHNLGSVRFRQNQYYCALGFYKRAQILLEENNPRNQTDLASVYESLASVYFDQAKYELAREFCMKSLNIRRDRLDEKHPSIASSHVKLGRIYSRLQNYEMAMDCYNQALQITDNVAEVYMNLGDLYSFQDKHTNALDFYEKALVSYKSVYGDNHTYTATAYCSMGGAHYSLDNYDEAVKSYIIALQIYDKVYPKHHTTIAVALNNVGNIFFEIGHLDDALGLYVRALDIYRVHFNETHPKVLTSRKNLAQCYKAMATECVENQRWQDALNLCQQALDIYEKVLSVGSSERESTLTALQNDMRQLRELIASATDNI